MRGQASRIFIANVVISDESSSDASVRHCRDAGAPLVGKGPVLTYQQIVINTKLFLIPLPI